MCEVYNTHCTELQFRTKRLTISCANVFKMRKPVSVNQFFVLLKSRIAKVHWNPKQYISIERCNFLQRVAAKQKSGTLGVCVDRSSVQCMCSMKCARKIYDLVTPRNRKHRLPQQNVHFAFGARAHIGQVYLRYNLSSLLTQYRHSFLGEVVGKPFKHVYLYFHNKYKLLH